jgi:hypothetical protein
MAECSEFHTAIAKQAIQTDIPAKKLDLLFCNRAFMPAIYVLSEALFHFELSLTSKALSFTRAGVKSGSISSAFL